MPRRGQLSFVSSRYVRTQCRSQCVCLTLLLLLLITLAPCLPAVAAAAGTDLTTHPVYAKYTFIRDGKHLYFSTQPSAAPEG